ncbi:isochorismatase family protein [Shimia sp.]|uniref:isochorismatase family protein n=1 Tax=Shimia sp. TaxID=1954381 RepID=UPI003299FB42
MKQTPLIAVATTLALALSLAGPNTALADDHAGFQPDRATTALLVVDPQNDFMSSGGKGWGLVGENVMRLGSNDHIETLIRTAKDGDIPVFVSPHGYFEHDAHWHDRGPVQALMHEAGLLKINGPAEYEGFEGSGADFYAPLKAMILDGDTVITTPHKVYGPDSNDLALQLRKRGIQTVIMGGFVANLCVDSHMRELVEQGFNVVVVKDVVGAPGEDAYDAAILNASMIANAVWDTDQAVAFLD